LDRLRGERPVKHNFESPYRENDDRSDIDHYAEGNIFNPRLRQRDIEETFS
jgi:hypothetical protein